MNRIKARSVGVYTFTARAEDEDGVLQEVSAPVSVTLRDGAGVEVITDEPLILEDGSLSFDCPTNLIPDLDSYSLTWSGVVGGYSEEWTTEFELVGGYIFEVADFRKEDRAFSDTEKYPLEAIRAIRSAVEDVIEGERAANIAFVPRGRRVTLDGNGRTGLTLPDYEVRGLYSVSIDGVELTEEEISLITVDDATLWMGGKRHFWPVGRRNIVVHYEHGKSHPPGAMSRAARFLAREYLVRSDLPSRATAQTIGDQTFRITVAGRDGITGIPDVDAAIEQFGRKSFRIG